MIAKELSTINTNNALRQDACRTGTAQIAAYFAVISMVILLAGCNPKAIPTVIFPAKPVVTPKLTKNVPSIATINIFAKDIVNPDADGVASPVQVRVYVTDDQTIFEGISFEQAFEFDSSTFGLKPKLIKTLQPDSMVTVDIEIPEKPSIVAVAAAFHDIGKTEWLSQFVVEKNQSQTISFILSDGAVTNEQHYGN